MTIFDIINSAEFVTADDRQVVQLDRAVWEELVTWLEHLKKLVESSVEQTQTNRALTLLQVWSSEPDEMGPEWWDDFEQELAGQRFSLREFE
jgi:hypothetical protein